MLTLVTTYDQKSNQLPELENMNSNLNRSCVPSQSLDLESQIHRNVKIGKDF